MEQDLNTFFDWMVSYAGKGESTAQHYKSGVSACSRDFLEWGLTNKPLMEMTLSELDVAVQAAFMCPNFVNKNRVGRNMYSNSLKQYRNFLMDNGAVLYDNLYEHFVDGALGLTERNAVIRARIGQGVFRERLFLKYGGRCIVTGVDDRRILLASHIRPWAVSSNEQRLSSENGLLLSPLYDKLFDSGLITFNSDGRIVCADDLSLRNRSLLRIDLTRCCLLDVSEEFLENMEYHRTHVFLGR